MSASSRSTAISKPATPDFRAAALEYFDARCQAFSGATELARSYHAVEGIHDLRVETKKLRAFLQLIGQISPTPVPRRHAKYIRRLFSVSGQARDLDIQQALLVRGLSRHQVSEYFNYLKEQEFAIRPALQDAMVEDVFVELKAIRRYVRECVTRVRPDVGRRRLIEATLQFALELRSLGSRKRVQGDQLHEVRKLAKTVRYCLDVVVVVAAGSRPLTSATKRLKAAYNHLGDWRDTEITLRGLEQFLKESNEESLYDRKAYSAFASDLKARRARDLKQFRRAWAVLRPTLDRLPGILRSERYAGR